MATPAYTKLTAKKAFTARNESEHSVTAGQEVYGTVSPEHPQFYIVDLDGRQGYVPAAIFEKKKKKRTAGSASGGGGSSAAQSTGASSSSGSAPRAVPPRRPEKSPSAVARSPPAGAPTPSKPRRSNPSSSKPPTPTANKSATSNPRPTNGVSANNSSGTTPSPSARPVSNRPSAPAVSRDKGKGTAENGVGGGRARASANSAGGGGPPAPSSQDDGYQTVDVRVSRAQPRNDGGKQVIMYEIVVVHTKGGNAKETANLRRYSEFFALMEKLNKMFPKLNVNKSFPPKKITKSSNPEVVAQRKVALDAWLQRMANDPNILYNPTFLEFIGLDLSDGSGAGVSAEVLAQARAGERDTNKPVSEEDRLRGHLRTAAYMMVKEMVALEQIDAVKTGAFLTKLKAHLKGKDEHCYLRMVEEAGVASIKYGDAAGPGAPVESVNLTESIDLGAVVSIVTAEEIPSIPKGTKVKVDLAFALLMADGSEHGFVAKSRVDLDNLVQGVREIVGSAQTSTATEASIKRLLEVETELRLIEANVDWQGVFESTPPDVPAPPSSFNFVNP